MDFLTLYTVILLCVAAVLVRKIWPVVSSLLAHRYDSLTVPENRPLIIRLSLSSNSPGWVGLPFTFLGEHLLPASRINYQPFSAWKDKFDRKQPHTSSCSALT